MTYGYSVKKIGSGQAQPNKVYIEPLNLLVKSRKVKRKTINFRMRTLVNHCKIINRTDYDLMKGMTEYCDNEGEKIYPSIETLAMASGMSKSTVQRCIKRLMAKNLLIKVRQGNRKLTCGYKFNVEELINSQDQRMYMHRKFREVLNVNYGKTPKLSVVKKKGELNRSNTKQIYKKTIHSNTKEEMEIQEFVCPLLEREAMGYGITRTTLARWVAKYTENVVREKFELLKHSKNVSNKAGFLNRALSFGWKLDGYQPIANTTIAAPSQDLRPSFCSVDDSWPFLPEQSPPEPEPKRLRTPWLVRLLRKNVFGEYFNRAESWLNSIPDEAFLPGGTHHVPDEKLMPGGKFRIPENLWPGGTLG